MDYVAHLQSSGATSRLQALSYSTRRVATLTMAILTMAILGHLPGRPSLTCDTCHIWQALALSEDDNVGRFATGCLANMRETILADARIQQWRVRTAHAAAIVIQANARMVMAMRLTAQLRAARRGTSNPTPNPTPNPNSNYNCNPNTNPNPYPYHQPLSRSGA
eukprot:scaffold80004_cov37-Phaeocystis_antarctica.AAC.2